jgi:peptide-methionine (S)-S-oxide reductase
MLLGRRGHVQKRPWSEGGDRRYLGTQYRSAIFYHTPEQKRVAQESKAKLEASHRFRRPIVTEITEASTFYPAEDYHQRYLEKRGLATCHI